MRSILTTIAAIAAPILVKPASALAPQFYSKITSPLAQAAAQYASTGEPVPPTLDTSNIQLYRTDTDTPTGADDSSCTATVATFAGGCFWGIQLAYDEEPGVLATCVGYTQGNAPYPSYADVCSEETGHTEACLVVFDPDRVSYARLADVLFDRIDDPTMLNRVGKDRGTQYRTGMYAHSDEQLMQAQKAYDRENSTWRTSGRTVMTEVKRADLFWPAEEEHQRYLAKSNGRC
mmetsp:Transcript_13946/g.30395  ORF Transcript_13946/g.30395 Transcript_13946/m.30395 type:complete len:233 (+) Transcript_13946:96-794(+)